MSKKAPLSCEKEWVLQGVYTQKAGAITDPAFQGDKGLWLLGGSDYLRLNLLLNPASPKSPEPSKSIFGYWFLDKV